MKGKIMKTLEEVYESCVNENPLARKMKFVIEAKRNNPDVTLKEVRSFLGYCDADKVKDGSLSQKFRTEIFFPVRNYVTKAVLKVDDSEAARLWARGETDEEVSAKRQKVNEKLPRATRESSKAASLQSIDFAELLGNFDDDDSDGDDFGDDD
jgi:hypothetical protein